MIRGKDKKERPCSLWRQTKAQEEIVGFVLIMIIVAVLLVIFIGFSLRTSPTEEIRSDEVESFIQASLQQTTDCKDNFGYLSVEKLIFGCVDSESCIDGRGMCSVLSETLREMIEDIWVIENRPLEGYELKISVDGASAIPDIMEGDKTINYRGGVQDFSRGGRSVQVFFRAYY